MDYMQHWEIILAILSGGALLRVGELVSAAIRVNRLTAAVSRDQLESSEVWKKAHNQLSGEVYELREAVQKLQAQIITLTGENEALRFKIVELERENISLKSHINALEGRVND
jgi:predicted RNase H-like nuclease (RuvC/YqgF family)